MTKYLVLKRGDFGVPVYTGNVVVDPPGVDTLVERGFVVPVSDDYPGDVVSLPSPTPPDEESETSETEGLSYRELQARAKELDISAGGSREELEERIAEEEARLAEQTPSPAPSGEESAPLDSGGGEEDEASSQSDDSGSPAESADGQPDG